MMIRPLSQPHQGSIPLSAFLLDPRLEADSVHLTSLNLCELRLMNDARFPWLLLIPRRAGATEIIDLDERDRLTLFTELGETSRALKAATACDKLNVAAIGNLVPQLHIHVVARFRTDAAWPRPVWGSGEAVAYEAAARDRLISRILASLPAPTAR
jgi:diadenosine tetraphosphate (Ap4A) HIT family hydrolase